MSSEYGADNSTERASKKRKRNAVEADDIVGLTLYKIGEPQLLLGVAASALKKFIDTNKAIDDHQQRIDEIATQFKRIKRNIEGRLMSVEPSGRFLSFS